MAKTEIPVLNANSDFGKCMLGAVLLGRCTVFVLSTVNYCNTFYNNRITVMILQLVSLCSPCCTHVSQRNLCVHM